MDKNIYKFELDGKTRYLDPLEMDIRFHHALSHTDGIDRKLEVLQNPDTPYELWIVTFKAISPGVYAMFGIPEFNEEDGSGYTLATLLDKYTEWLSWNSEVKKNTEPQPSSQPSTPEPETSDQASSGNTISPGADSGNSAMDSGSIAASPNQPSDAA